MKTCAQALALAGFILPAMGSSAQNVARETPFIVPQAQAYAPRSEPTEAPKVRWASAEERDLLFGRALSSNTCGFISGASSYFAFSCDPGTTCTNQPSNTFRGCCVGAACSSTASFITTCLDYSAPACAATASRGAGTLCCTNSATFPYCITYLFTTSDAPGTVYTQYNCDQSTFSGKRYFLTDSPPPSSSGASATSAATSTSTSTSSSTTSSAPASSSAAAGNGGGGSNNAGAIAGGVIGGLAGLAIIGFGIFFLLRRNTKNKPAQAPPAVPPANDPTAPTQMVQPTGTTYNPGDGYYQNSQYPQHSGYQQQQQYDPNYDPNYAASMSKGPGGDYSTMAGTPATHYQQQNMAGFGNHPSPSSQGVYPQQDAGPSFAGTPDHTSSHMASQGQAYYGTPLPQHPDGQQQISELPNQQGAHGLNRSELA